MTDEGGTDGSPRDRGAPLLPAIAEHPRGSEVPATGGKPARWLMCQGQYITVGELFVSGARRCSCWALYRIYKSLDIFIRKEQHSVSGSEGAVVLQNAKRKRHLDTGKFGLDL